ncbi:hypothetical protein [Clostridium sp. DL1XJH146]
MKNSFKKVIISFFALVFVVSTITFKVSASTVLPEIFYFVPDHTMAVENEPFSFAVQANGSGQVQYRIWVQNKATSKWIDLTNGYSESLNVNTPFVPEAKVLLSPGKYKAVVWVKRANVTGSKSSSFGDYDNYKVYDFSIQKTGYFDNRADLTEFNIESTYYVGDKIQISGKSNVEYKFHYYAPSELSRAENWYIDSDYQSSGNSSYVFTKPGTYLLDIWGRPIGSSVRFDGWVLKTVTVLDKPIETFNVVSIE